jgi:hypothetical protein
MEKQRVFEISNNSTKKAFPMEGFFFDIYIVALHRSGASEPTHRSAS